MNLNMSKQVINTLVEHREVITEAWYENQFIAPNLCRWHIDGLDQIVKETAITSFVEPLFDLLVEFLLTEDKKYLYGYLDERLRYAPHRESPEIRNAFFHYVINEDLQFIFDILNTKSLLKDGINVAFKRIHQPLIENHEDTLSVLALGDCLMNEIRVFLPHISAEQNTPTDVRCIYFSAQANKGIDLTEIKNFIDNNTVDVIALSLLSYEALPLFSMLLNESASLSKREIEARIEHIIVLFSDMLEGLRKKTEVPLLIHNVSGIPLGRYRKRLPFLPVFSGKTKFILQTVNAKISDLVNATSNAVLIDEYGIAKKNGFRESAKSMFPKRIVGAGFLHTGKLGYFLSQRYAEIVNAYAKLKQCKVLMVDFDNTLWHGVMGDEEVEHIPARQKLLKNLKDAGILLVSVSKNTESNIRWDEMILQPDDFVMHKINWDLKVQSISTAVNDLNIGIDSVVFIDDNPVELDMVSKQLPEVVCLNATEEKTWHDLALLFSFPATKQTEESKKRTEMYREAFERNRTINSEQFDYAQMMSSLGLSIEFRPAEKGELERVYELVSRTNQFNTTTIRYSKVQLAKFLDSTEYQILVSTLSDKFGDLGIVVVVILKFEDDTAIIDSFIMSCRAMGFMLENQILHLLTTNKYHKKTSIIGSFFPTDRNTPCAGLYSSNHFEKLDDNTWQHIICQSGSIENVGWITCM